MGWFRNYIERSEVDCDFAVTTADLKGAVAEARRRLGIAERRFAEGSIAWEMAGKPFKGEVYKELVKAQRKVLRRREQYADLNSRYLSACEAHRKYSTIRRR